MGSGIRECKGSVKNVAQRSSGSCGDTEIASPEERELSLRLILGRVTKKCNNQGISLCFSLSPDGSRKENSALAEAHCLEVKVTPFDEVHPSVSRID